VEKMREKKLFIVHCIDTEGPLNETIEATFERIKHIYHIDLKPSKDTLIKLQNGEIDLNGKENSVKNTLNPHFLNYNNNWTKVEEMLEDCLSEKFRSKFKDSNGNGWIYNWHCVDHVDYEYNPRGRDIGYHKIFDKYNSILKKTNSFKDGLHFHYHPHPMVKHAHLCATRWLGPTDKLFQILSRRIIDRSWFPSTNRPGFQVTRPDSHWFLEQFIPFDYASLSIEESDDFKEQFDLSAGRSGDWRRAPVTWVPYHPAHDDYQSKGDCKRWIARCLNIGTRFANVNYEEVERAFKETDEGKNAILSFANHDFRDLRKDVEEAYSYIAAVSKKYPNVKFEFSEGAGAMREALSLENIKKCELSLDMQKINEKTHVLEINSSQNIFGTQPFLAIKTKEDKYFHDNLDFQIPKRKWTYTFDEETLYLQDIDKIGLAVNSPSGRTTISNLDVKSGKVEINYLNN
jgi:hypothetical protein